jgi:tetratricopeptide (TPR) repeat protein
MNDKDKPEVSPPPAEPIVDQQKNAGQPPSKAAPGAGKQLSLGQALTLARQFESNGQLDRAERLLRQILRAQPSHTDSLHLLSVVTHRLGQTELALQLIDQAIAADANNSLFHSNRGEVCRVLGRFDEAIASGERAVELNPDMAAPLSNIGIAYYDQENYQKAEEYQQRALKIDPKFLAALNNLGSIRRNDKDRTAAIDFYRQALQIDPDYMEAMNNLGAVLTEDDRYEDAVKVLIQAFRKRPGYADVHCNLGFAFLGMEQYERSKKAFAKAIELKPAYTEAFFGLARVHQEENHLAEAEQVALAALEIDAEKSEVHSALGGIYTEMGYPDKARQAYDEALRLEPDSVRGLIGLGALLMELGALEESEATFERALEIDPASTAARVSLSHVRKTKPDDTNMQALIEEAGNTKKLSRPKATSLNYALGKCYDDVGEYDDAFTHFAAGAQLKRSSIQYDAADQQLLISNLIKYLDQPTVDRFSGTGNPSELPVFVLGMARSGTTLTEQILASHPQVHGAGELPDLLDLVREPRGPTGDTPFPHSMQHLNHADLGLLGERYVTGLRARHPDAARITDKMPANFLAVGLIHLILPNARIIHLRRDPVDTCLSSFSRLYNHGQPHSYDLAEIGAYYRGYAKLMDHWHTVLPAGTILDMVYEELVADNETQARRLIEHCGLEWDDACLDFHKTERAVRTASVTQVRQPIYNTSVQRWKRYESHLGPLLDALGDLVPA